MFWSPSSPLSLPCLPFFSNATEKGCSLCPPGLGMLAWSHPAPRSRGVLCALGPRSTAYWVAVLVPFNIIDHDCSAFVWLLINYVQVFFPTPFAISPAMLDMLTMV